MADFAYSSIGIWCRLLFMLYAILPIFGTHIARADQPAGFFHVEQIDGEWKLLDPSDTPFYLRASITTATDRECRGT